MELAAIYGSLAPKGDSVVASITWENYPHFDCRYYIDLSDRLRMAPTEVFALPSGSLRGNSEDFGESGSECNPSKSLRQTCSYSQLG